jgi:hypothetical protein
MRAPLKDQPTTSPVEKRQSDAEILRRAITSISRSTAALADALERRSAIFFPILFVLYVWILKSDRIKRLWHDELYTFYIAQAPSFAQMMEWTRTIDLNPPLYYIAARLSMHLFHPSAFSVRLPSMVAYFVATMCAYLFVRRRLTPLYGLIAAMVMLSSSFNQYSYEARPYAFVLGFLGILALGWQSAIQNDKPRNWAAYLLVLFGGFGMLLSHVLASVAYAALLLTEAIRFFMRRKPDWILWICLALPLSACITYLQPIQTHSSGAFPEQFQASILDLLAAYSDLWVGLASLLCAAIIIIVLLGGDRKAAPPNPPPRGFTWPEKILAVGFCCVPLVVGLLFMHSHSAFFPRYGIPSIFGVAILAPWFVSRWTGNSSLAALVCSIVFIFGVVTPLSIARHVQSVVQPIKPQGPPLTGKSDLPLSQISPELPLVDASGLTFLEMNNREDTTFLSRVYYLNDAQSAVKYANATIFEGFPGLKDKFPIRGKIMPYQEFIQQHSKFLVYGTYDYPEDWLLRKLLADQASLRFVGNYDTGYKDEQVYEVTLAPSATENKP